MLNTGKDKDKNMKDFYDENLKFDDPEALTWEDGRNLMFNEEYLEWLDDVKF